MTTIKKSLRSLIVLSVLAVSVLTVFLSIRSMLKIQEDSNKEYPKIGYEDSIEGEVEDIFNPPRHRISDEFVRVKFRNQSKGSFHTLGEALNSPDIFIRDVIVNGSYVRKRAFSDTVIVDYSGVKYQFIVKGDD